MNVRPILDPLPDENVLAVSPALAPEPDATWNRRLHFYGGRTLSDLALTTEQNERASRLTLAGQLLSPGVISGLEAGLEQATDGDQTRAYIHISPGSGLTASGEMVTLATPLHSALAALPIYAPSALLDGGNLPQGGGEVARRLGPSLGQAIAQGIALPRAAVLVLQPITAQIVGRTDPGDSCEGDLCEGDLCEVDPTAAAFDDWQLVDGCRLVLFLWPGETLSLPEPGPAWRNRIAYAIFEQERKTSTRVRWPWQELGLPVGLLALDEALNAAFLDRYSVVRGGGKAKPRRPLASGGDPALWQARIQQFAEEVAEAAADAAPVELDPAQLAQRFENLPPVGLLPRQALSLDTQTDHFFPADYRLSAQPIPLEQLDLALRESAPLAPLQRGQAEQVEILAPVPQAWYEPRLLLEESVSDEFDEAIAEFAARRGEWLARRRWLRRIASAFNQAITGEALIFPEPDPDALEADEAVSEGALDPAEVLDAKVRVRTNDGDPVLDEFGDPVLDVLAVESLADYLRERTPLKKEEVSQLSALGLTGFVDFLDGKVRAANDTVDLSFLRVQTDIYRLRQQVLGADEATRLATSPVLAAIAKGESAYATRKDLQTFVAGLKATAQPEGDAAAPLGDLAPDDTPQPAADIGSRLFVSGAQSRISPTVASGLGTTRIDLGSTSSAIDPTIKLARQGPALGEFGQVVTDPLPLRPPTRDDITEQAPIVGVGYDFRTTAVVQRNPEPPAIQTRSASIATKHSTLSAVLDIGINVDDVMVPGFQGDTSRRPLKEFGESGLLDEILRGVHDPVPQDDRHESNFFNAGVKALENTVSVLRGVEGQIKAYKVALDRCKATLADLQQSAAEARRRLNEIDDEVAEARHDVSVARTLLAEEEQRIAAINHRRSVILRDHTPFLVYRRRRVAPTVVQTPARAIDPGFSQPPLAACLGRSITTPPELQELVSLMRRAPVAWFVDLDALVDRIDRPQTLLLTMQAAKVAASTATASFAATSLPTTTSSAANRFGSAINSVMRNRQNTAAVSLAQTAAVDLNAVAGLSWQNSRSRATQVVSVGDLIDGAHGKSDVAAKAAGALDEIEQVATCLYEAISELPPILRLAWAELLSQFDAPVGLRNLASLPRWGEIDDVLQRREMQLLVDWLYARVHPQLGDAVDLVNDLVRVCILLASHSPVNQIIAGAVHEPVTARPGGRVKIAVNSTTVRVGMPVYLYRNEQVVAQAVVDDLQGGLASARFVQLSQSLVEIDQGARAHFGEIRALRRG